MPKMKFPGLPTDEPDVKDGAGFSSYDGPKPPIGVYKGTLKRTVLKMNKNGEPMVSALVEINEPKSSTKAKYNGYGIWGNINVTDKGAPFVRLFAEAIGATYKQFKDNMLTDSENPSNILKVGAVKLTGDNMVRVTTRNNTYNGEVNLQIGQFLPLEDAVDEGDIDEDDVEDAGDDTEDADDDEPAF